VSLTVPVAELVNNSSDPLLAIDSSWDRIPLGKVAKILNGFAFKSELFNNSKGLPLIRIRDISNTNTECFYNGSFDETYVINPGDLLIGMDGDFNCSTWKGPKALLNQRVCKIEVNSAIYDRKFIEYVLPGYLKAINDNTSSQTVKHLSSRSISEIPLPFPSLPEQQHIVARVEALLANVNAARERLQRVPLIMKKFRQAVLAAACSGRLTEGWREGGRNVETGSQLYSRLIGDKISESIPDDNDPPLTIPEIPENWKWTRCEALSNPKRDITYGVIKLGTQFKGGIPTLRSSDVRWLFIDNTDVKTIDPKIASQYSRTFLQGGEIVITVRGSLGGIAVVPKTMAGYNVSREVAVLPLLSELNSYYFCYAIASIWCQNWLSEVTKGVAYTGINIRDLKRLPIPLPPLAEQHEIVRRVEALFARADTVEREVAAATKRADALTQAVLAKAFAGKL